MKFRDWINGFQDESAWVLFEGTEAYLANPDLYHKRVRRPYKNTGNEHMIFVAEKSSWIKYGLAGVFFTPEEWNTAFQFCFEKTKAYHESNPMSPAYHVYSKDWSKMPIQTKYLSDFKK